MSVVNNEISAWLKLYVQLLPSTFRKCFPGASKKCTSQIQNIFKLQGSLLLIWVDTETDHYTGLYLFIHSLIYSFSIPASLLFMVTGVVGLYPSIQQEKGRAFTLDQKLVPHRTTQRQMRHTAKPPHTHSYRRLTLTNQSNIRVSC